MMHWVANIQLSLYLGVWKVLPSANAQAQADQPAACDGPRATIQQSSGCHRNTSNDLKRHGAVHMSDRGTARSESPILTHLSLVHTASCMNAALGSELRGAHTHSQHSNI